MNRSEWSEIINWAITSCINFNGLHQLNADDDCFFFKSVVWLKHKKLTVKRTRRAKSVIWFVTGILALLWIDKRNELKWNRRQIDTLNDSAAATSSNTRCCCCCCSAVHLETAQMNGMNASRLEIIIIHTFIDSETRSIRFCYRLEAINKYEATLHEIHCKIFQFRNRLSFRCWRQKLQQKWRRKRLNSKWHERQKFFVTNSVFRLKAIKRKIANEMVVELWAHATVCSFFFVLCFVSLTFIYP